MISSTVPDVSVIMVSYNTRDLTLRAIETLLENAGDVAIQLIVWDNDSRDGSAEAVAERFPDIQLIRSQENLGFAKANNAAAALVKSEWVLLLNPDTETHPRAVENILAFAKKNPKAGIVGGRTVFPDNSLNIASCMDSMTIWSLFCSATGLSRIFAHTRMFNPEHIGGWKRDTVRHVDVVVGCFLLIRTDLWNQVGGFSERYFMYSEDHDLCLRVAKLGYRPMITPEAQIMHLVGASSKRREDKMLLLMRSKATLIRDHWAKSKVPVGIAMLWLWIGTRRLASWMHAKIRGRETRNDVWHTLWTRRHDWLTGY